MKKTRCFICQRQCLIDEGRLGFCQTRKNIAGKIVSLLYGKITGIQIDPIEKKPFYHFKPGSLVATIGSFGCNFRCKQCLNYQTTWGANLQLLKNLPKISPKQIAQEITASGYAGIAFSYNEPVLWVEFAADIATQFKIQNSKFKNKKRFAVFVTNGSWTKKTIDMLSAIDAANIDLKGFSEKTYQKMGALPRLPAGKAGLFGKIPQMAVYAQKKKIFLEMTTLLIPTINDNWDELKKMTNFIVQHLGPNTPWHLSEFDPNLAPDKEFQKLPFTPIENLQKAFEIGRSQGLNHVYVWAPQNRFFISDTLCPKCKNTVIKRDGWTPTEIFINQNSTCRFCGYKLNVIL